MKILLIPAHGLPREAELPDDGGARLRRSVTNFICADYAERIQVTTRWEAWLDENGSATGKPVNQAATRLARAYGAEYVLLGTVVVTGLDDTGEPTGLSPAQVGIILGKITAPAA